MKKTNLEDKLPLIAISNILSVNIEKKMSFQKHINKYILHETNVNKVIHP